ncbi:MAG: hypothetical protein ACK559_36345, partial [bacterium]
MARRNHGYIRGRGGEKNHMRVTECVFSPVRKPGGRSEVVPRAHLYTADFKFIWSPDIYINISSQKENPDQNKSGNGCN